MAIQVAVPNTTSADDLVARLAFSVKTEELGGRRYAVALAGEVDMQTAPEFERELLATIEDGARELVIDLTSASFIDSSLLHALLHGQERLRRRGGRLSIVCGDRNLVRVFEITGLDRVFSIHSPLEGTSRRPGASSLPHLHAARQSPHETKGASVGRNGT